MSINMIKYISVIFGLGLFSMTSDYLRYLAKVIRIKRSKLEINKSACVCNLTLANLEGNYCYDLQCFITLIIEKLKIIICSVLFISMLCLCDWRSCFYWKSLCGNETVVSLVCGALQNNDFVVR